MSYPSSGWFAFTCVLYCARGTTVEQNGQVMLAAVAVAGRAVFGAEITAALVVLATGAGGGGAVWLAPAASVYIALMRFLMTPLYLGSFTPLSTSWPTRATNRWPLSVSITSST